jgi:RNA polymerase sigma factor (sigma-70 family)
MSPLGVRRYRAERVLREDFERLRSRVLARVGARLQARGVLLDAADLEACYAHAWQGLYGVLLDGREIDNAAGWLVVVTFRRALDEYRSRTRACGGHDPLTAAAPARRDRGEHSGHGGEVADTRGSDPAADLDDRQLLRALMEAMRCRLSEREREAASLCYLQGLSRRQAAARMGLSESRMRKLMDGVPPRRPGVARKLGALVADVRDGRWCDEQASLMRALAFGVLDPDGERYRVAVVHRRECPACRAYVASLRGLAAALPPVLAPLRMGALAMSHAAGAGAGAASGHGSGPAGAASGHASGPVAAGAGSAPGIGVGAVGGAGAAKLAAGCLLVLGVGAGCVALGGAGSGSRAPVPRGPGRPAVSRSLTRPSPALAAGGEAAHAGRVVPAAPAPAPRSSLLRGAGHASREFTPEQPAAVEPPPAAVPRAGIAAARGVGAGSATSSGGAAAAEREFSP